MGIDGAGRRTGGGRGLTLTSIVRVVPDLPSFAVDGGFAYAVPDELTERISVGSIVRVPLSGRRVRGYVTELTDGSTDGLKSVRTVSGAWPCFTPATLQTLRWAATHYVAPLSVVLGKTAPPNLPRKAGERALPSVPPTTSPVPEVTEAAVAGRHGRVTHLLTASPYAEGIRRTVTPVVRAGRSVMIVAPTVAEVRALADDLGRDFGSRVVEVADQSDATVTTAWSVTAAQSGLVLVGTPRVVWWPVETLSLAVVVEPGRRSMKERQTPAVAVDEVMRRRGAVERFPVLQLGRVPTVEGLSRGVDIRRGMGRLWPQVEIVDRGEEPPGSGVVSVRAKTAIAATTGRGGRVLVFTHRRGYSSASRCVACRTLRTCQSCGSRPDPGTTCTRCAARLTPCENCGGSRFEPLGAAFGRVVEELRRVVGARVGSVDDGRPVMVGTERDLVGVTGVDLAVAVDADGLVRGTNYRAAEDALALLARVASTVRSASGNRMMVQTADPAHPLFTALRRSDPEPFLSDDLKTRSALGLPPLGEVIVLETSETDELNLLDGVFDGATAFGPAVVRDRLRWLIQGDDLTEVRKRLAAAAAKLRDRGVRVRIDVDPREL